MPGLSRLYFEVQLDSLEGGARADAGSRDSNDSDEPLAGLGVCVGLADGAHGLDRLVGSSPRSLGFYSTGHIVSNGAFIPYGCAVGPGDLLGVLINVLPLSSEPLAVGEGAQVQYCLDMFHRGEPWGRAPASLTLPAAEPAYVTVSLHSARSCVLGRFDVMDLATPAHVLQCRTWTLAGQVIPNQQVSVGLISVQPSQESLAGAAPAHGAQQ